MIRRQPGTRALVASVAKYFQGGSGIKKIDLYHHAIKASIDPREQARKDAEFYQAMGDKKKAEKARSRYAEET